MTDNTILKKEITKKLVRLHYVKEVPGNTISDDNLRTALEYYGLEKGLPSTGTKFTIQLLEKLKATH